jgi:hypothetical protein
MASIDALSIDLEDLQVSVTHSPDCNSAKSLVQTGKDFDSTANPD